MMAAAAGFIVVVAVVVVVVVNALAVAATGLPTSSYPKFQVHGQQLKSYWMPALTQIG